MLSFSHRSRFIAHLALALGANACAPSAPSQDVTPIAEEASVTRDAAPPVGEDSAVEPARDSAVEPPPADASAPDASPSIVGTGVITILHYGASNTATISADFRRGAPPSAVACARNEAAGTHCRVTQGCPEVVDDPRERVSAGEITLGDGANVHTLSPMADGRYASVGVLESVPLESGVPITIRADGAAVPAFMAEQTAVVVTGLSPVTMGGALLTRSRAMDLALSARTVEGSFVPSLLQGGLAVDCERAGPSPDVTIPASALRSFANGRATLLLAARSQRVVMAGGYRVTIQVSQFRTVFLDLVD
jgi:hypothetical protein